MCRSPREKTVEWSVSSARKVVVFCAEKEIFSVGKQGVVSVALSAWPYSWSYLEAQDKAFSAFVKNVCSARFVFVRGLDTIDNTVLCAAHHLGRIKYTRETTIKS
jgi:hypothetical protein